jgi:hypothetical protein
MVSGKKTYTNLAAANRMAFWMRIANGLRPEMVPIVQIVEHAIVR